jgi:hypothetical protein
MGSKEEVEGNKREDIGQFQLLPAEVQEVKSKID